MLGFEENGDVIFLHSLGTRANVYKVSEELHNITSPTIVLFVITIAPLDAASSTPNRPIATLVPSSFT